MSMTIFIRKHTESERFKPHFNRTMGRRYDTKEDYLKDLKSKGLEPYRPDQVKAPELKKHILSPWARAMTNAVRGKKKIEKGSRVDLELRKRKINLFEPPKAPEGTSIQQGGFY